MGMAYGNLGNVAKKKECFQKAADLGDTDAQKWLRDGEQASSAKTATEYVNDGNAALAKENYPLAIQHFQKAVEIDPNYAEAKKGLAKSYYDMAMDYYLEDKYEEAIRCYQKIIEIAPRANVYKNMGDVYGEQGDTAKKVECYQKAARLNNTTAQEWLKENGYEW
jgi:tetratricopeptide (TPR) repeat protein